MFPNSVFPTSMFTPNYWPKTGAQLPTGHGPKVGGRPNPYYASQIKRMMEEEDEKNRSLIKMAKKMIFNDLLRMVLAEVFENIQMAQDAYPEIEKYKEPEQEKEE